MAATGLVGGMRFTRPHVPACLRKLFKRKRGTGSFFALWPRRLANGTWVWLETVERYRLPYGKRVRR